MEFIGRKQILIDRVEITKENIESIVAQVLKEQKENMQQIDYLMKYEKGITPIRSRVKSGRQDIDNRISENHAAEIKTFKVGYVFSSPITLVQRAVEGNKQDDKRIAQLNEWMFEQGKVSKDKMLAEDFTICGIGFRMALPNTKKDGSPFVILPLSPLTTCVVYWNDIYKDRALGISYTICADGKLLIGAYTDRQYFSLEGSELGGQVRLVGEPQVNGIGIVPIVEYRADDQRMGCFERAIPLMDALDVVTSDRVNDLSQFVANILWADNVTVTPEQKEEVKNGGWLFTQSDSISKATIQYLTQQLDQTNTQALTNWLYEQILQITGTPQRGKSTGGNTGQAIVLSNGWEIAETAAKNTEIVFKDSERQFLEVVLKILEKDMSVSTEMKTLRLCDIESKFSRNKTDSLLAKVQALQVMISTGIAPLAAIKTVDLFSDPQQVYVDSIPTLTPKKEVEE